MKKLPENEEKELADVLAESIYTGRVNNDKLTHALMRFSHGNRRQGLSERENNAASAAQKTVGIWKMEFENGEKIFVRDPQFSDEFVYWADVSRLETKSGKCRIAMLGESVARGWPIDPGYNPCISLKRIFDKVGFDVDIIDLARTNCGIDDLKRLSRECLELEPDALVIFGGNNWIVNCQQKFFRESNLVEKVVDKVTQHEYEALKESVQSIITQEIGDFFGQLGKISKENNLPVFVIVPEFNLRDWHSNDLEKLPLFNADDIPAWYQTCSDTEEALSKRELEKAERLCNQLIELFPSNPRGYELKAECKLMAGKDREAKKHYREAAETKLYQTSCPCITATMQEQVRKMVALHDLLLIDLPLIFEAHLGSQLPGREMFLDYCHLSVEGINISMYHLMSKIFSEICKTNVSITLDEIIHLGHENVNDAKSHFLAAIHNSHWGQHFEIIYHHCKKALSYYDISDYMLAYVKATNSACPGQLNKDFGLLVESGIFSTYILLTLQSNGTETFNLTLCSAIMRALKDASFDQTESINTLRRHEHFTGMEKVDLLQSYYHNGYNYNLSKKLKKVAYYREYFKYSSFFIMSDAVDRNLTLDIVHRFPYSAYGTIEFEMNGIKIGEANSGKSWSKDSIAIPSNTITNGLNVFVIHWPLKHVSNSSSRTAAILENPKDLERLHAEMYPVIGEIHFLQLIYKNSENNEPIELSVGAELPADS